MSTKTKQQNGFTTPNVMENLAIIPSETNPEKGLYPAGLTTEQMLAFVPAYPGVIIFNTDTKRFMTYQNGEWVNFATQLITQLPIYDTIPENPANGTIYYYTGSRNIKLHVDNAVGTIPVVFLPPAQK